MSDQRIGTAAVCLTRPPCRTARRLLAWTCPGPLPWADGRTLACRSAGRPHPALGAAGAGSRAAQLAAGTAPGVRRLPAGAPTRGPRLGAAVGALARLRP